MKQVFGRERLTFGVEEEFLLVDARTRIAAARADRVVAEARRTLGEQVEPEFYRTQLEIHSTPRATAEHLRRDLARCRRVAARAAAHSDCLLVAAPCAIRTHHPLPTRRDGRYLRISEHLGPVLTAADCEISGCHIHLGSRRYSTPCCSAPSRRWMLSAICPSRRPS